MSKWVKDKYGDFHSSDATFNMDVYSMSNGKWASDVWTAVTADSFERTTYARRQYMTSLSEAKAWAEHAARVLA